jgi:cytochrome c-type biogenesis protein CcmF
MRNPSVHNLWLKDLYISPIQRINPEEEVNGQDVVLKKGENKYFEDFNIIFSGYDIDEHQMSSQELHIPAILNITSEGQEFRLTPAIKINNNKKTDLPATFPGTNRKVYIKDINVNENTLVLFIENEKRINNENDREMLAVEVTEKPLINLVWLGTFLMVGGMLTAIINRVKFNKFS